MATKLTLLSPEMKVLLACLPISRQGWVERESVVHAVRGAVVLDWSHLLELAGFHGLVPMLTHALAATGWKAVPPSVRQQLERRQMNHVKSSLRSVSALHELHGYFDRLNLRAVSWKGPVLAADLYGSCALRESGDLDVLVDASRMDEAVEIVEFLEFKRHQKADRASTCRLVAKLDQEYCFYRSSDGTYLELHTQIMPERFSAWQDMAQQMRHAEQKPLGSGRTVLSLSPEDHLISICGHGIKHHWERLKWLADVALYLRVHRDTLDWKGLVARTKKSGRFDALLHSCLLAERVFGAPLPRELHASAPAPELEILTAKVAGWICSGQLRELPHELASEQLALLFPSRFSRLRFALRRLTEPNLTDLQEARPGLSPLVRWRRIRRELQVQGMFEKTVASWRTIW